MNGFYSAFSVAVFSASFFPEGVTRRVSPASMGDSGCSTLLPPWKKGAETTADSHVALARVTRGGADPKLFKLALKILGAERVAGPETATYVRIPAEFVTTGAV